MDRDGSCLYRGPNNRKCAIGWLIADKLYNPFFEALDLSLVLNKLSADKQLTKLSSHFLHDLQLVHDENSVTAKNGKWNKDFKRALKGLGQRYKLKTKFLKKLELK